MTQIVDTSGGAAAGRCHAYIIGAPARKVLYGLVYILGPVCYSLVLHDLNVSHPEMFVTTMGARHPV